MPARNLEQYRSGLAARRRQRLEALEARRLAILGRVRAAASRLLALGAARVLIFGSILAANRFHPGSDVDVIVYGLPAGKWHETLLFFEEYKGLEEVVIDLKFAAELPGDFLSFVEKNGEILEPPGSADNDPNQ